MEPHPDNTGSGPDSTLPDRPESYLARLNNSRKALQFSLSRKLLFFWIKPTFLGGTPENLGISDTDQVCYVLPYRSTADLLVVDKACELGGLQRTVDPIPGTEETRAFFFLGRPEGTLGRKSLRHQSLRMTRLFELQNTVPGTAVKIVPVSIFWGHQPDREKSVFKLLLSEHWSATSGMKKFLAMLFHPRHILVQFGEPISLAGLAEEENDGERQIRRLGRLLRVHFNNQRQAIIGPDLSHRRTLINTILESAEVRHAVEREARRQDVAYAEVEKRAVTYAEEIASDQSYRVIRFFDVLLTWLWNNLYGGIEVNQVDIVKQLAQSHEIIYIPCHRSHIDYLLLSYVLYHNGLTPPHIAAGKNLNLPLVGPLLRRAGAFFMRRSFQGDNLYKEVFDEYLHQMFTKGYSVEYFIEGGRSRTGRTLPPRTGMLRMTVRSFQKDNSKPIAFLPVYFGYERVLESNTYMAELSGKDKRTESFFDMFGIFSSFRREFGVVTVNFGEPVLLQSFLDSRLVGWTDTGAVSTEQFNDACQGLAETLATRINAAAAVKPVNLIAVALLATTRQNIEERHLKSQIDRLRIIATQCHEPGISVTDLPAEAILQEAIDIVGLTRTSRQFGNIISATTEQSVTLTYNANNVAHIYAMPSLVARFLITNRRSNRDELIAFCAELYPFLQAEMFLPWQKNELSLVIDRIASCFCEMHLATKHTNAKKTDNYWLEAPAPESEEFNCLDDIAGITTPSLERFSVVMALVSNSPESSIKALEAASIGIAEQLSVLYGINSPDFFDKSLFSTFLTNVKRQGFVDQDLVPAEDFAVLDRTIARTLDAGVRYNILQAVTGYRTKTS